nr:hypothetical protein [Paenibacillus bovis]
MFPNGVAIIDLDGDERYKVRTTAGEVLFIGRGYDEAVSRIRYAEPTASIDIVKDGKRCSAAQFKQRIAPTVFLVSYSENTSNNVLYGAMDARKGRKHIGSWHFIGDEYEVAWEIREVVEEIGEHDNTAIRFSHKGIRELDDIKGANIDAGKLDFTEVRKRAGALKRRYVDGKDKAKKEAKVC